MTSFEFLSAASMPAVMPATPAMARRSCLANVRVPKIASVTGSPTSGGRIRIIAPRIGAHVTAPANARGGVCDFGDNPMIY
jgi:hypothetical protein